LPTIALKFYATLRRYAPPGREREVLPHEVAPGTTVAALITELGIPDGEELAVVVGNRIVMPGYVLQDGDAVSLLPPVVGG
jgi:sulfur carrier protein ThiS